jgi:hypothetical protein
MGHAGEQSPLCFTPSEGPPCKASPVRHPGGWACGSTLPVSSLVVDEQRPVCGAMHPSHSFSLARAGMAPHSGESEGAGAGFEPMLFDISWSACLLGHKIQGPLRKSY